MLEKTGARKFYPDSRSDAYFVDRFDMVAMLLFITPAVLLLLCPNWKPLNLGYNYYHRFSLFINRISVLL